MKISLEEEKRLLIKLFTNKGMSEEDAGILATVVCHSDFCGVESHGMSRALEYLWQMSAGGINTKANLTAVLDSGAVMAFDCENGSGVVSVCKAYDRIKERAREYGIAMAVGKKSANIGCGNYYASRAADEGLILIACSNTGLLMAPYGGAEPMLGSNPIFIGAPGGEEYGLGLDTSTTACAWGKIVLARRAGKELEDNIALDQDGAPTKDPNKVHSIQPFASYKGYGFAVMVDLFSAILGGGGYGRNIGLDYKGEPDNTGWAMIVIDPSKFMPLDAFRQRSDDYVRMVKGCRRAPGFDEILLPGEKERKTFETRTEAGFEINEALQNEVLECARQAGLADADTTFEMLVNRV